MNTKPVVLCFSGIDPTGGAGIQADIEAISAQHCHASSVVTALTVQDTQNVHHFECVNTQLLLQQAHAVLHDMNINAIKIGMLGNAANAQAIHSLLLEYPQIPVIIDPVLAAGGGGDLSSTALIDAINQLILPHATITTPNTPEACKLAACDKHSDESEIISKLSATGVTYILLTGTHAATQDVQHRLYRGTDLLQSYSYERLHNEYHGSGCTLAACLAALIAKQIDVPEAVQLALDYTYSTLLYAHAAGKGQLIPNRFFQEPK